MYYCEHKKKSENGGGGGGGGLGTRLTESEFLISYQKFIIV